MGLMFLRRLFLECDSTEITNESICFSITFILLFLSKTATKIGTQF